MFEKQRFYITYGPRLCNIYYLVSTVTTTNTATIYGTTDCLQIYTYVYILYVFIEVRLHKLLSADVLQQLINFLDSFLQDRTFWIKIIDLSREIEAGVTQGSCLSLLLYVIYINGIPTARNTKMALFSDDTLYYTSNRNFKYVVVCRLYTAVECTSRWKIHFNI